MTCPISPVPCSTGVPALALLIHDHGLRSALWPFSTSSFLRTIFSISLHQFKPTCHERLIFVHPFTGVSFLQANTSMATQSSTRLYTIVATCELVPPFQGTVNIPKGQKLCLYLPGHTSGTRQTLDKNLYLEGLRPLTTWTE